MSNEDQSASVSIETGQRYQFPHPCSDVSVTVEKNDDSKTRVNDYMNAYRSDNQPEQRRHFDGLCDEHDVRYDGQAIPGSYYQPGANFLLNFLYYIVWQLKQFLQSKRN